MWITKEMSEDFKEAKWNPSPQNLETTLEDICDALYSIGYRIEITKGLQ